MKISEVIEKLEWFKRLYGDIDVLYHRIDCYDIDIANEENQTFDETNFLIDSNTLIIVK
jgi:hypothetical protein